MSQKTASNGSENIKDQLQNTAAAPLLNDEKELILKELTYVDIHGDRAKESESDIKMLNWTLNEIRRTCGKLPNEKLRFLIEHIKKVMVEKSVYQGMIEKELKKHRDQLKKEVDDDQKTKPNESLKENIVGGVMKFIQDRTDLRLFKKNRIEKIGEITPAEKAKLLIELDENTDTMSKFMQWFSNDVRWRKGLQTEHPKSHAILEEIYNKLATKYKIKIEKDDTLAEVKRKVTDAKIKFNEWKSHTEQAQKFADTISQNFLNPLEKKIQKIIDEDVKNNSPMTFFNIASVFSNAQEISVKIRKSEQYKKFLKLAEESDDKEIRKKFTIFSEKLSELDSISGEYSSILDARKLPTEEKQFNVLSRLKTKIRAVGHGLQKGESLVEYYNKEKGNTSKSISEFEIEIKASLAEGWAKNVNSRGLSEYIKALRVNGTLNHDYLRNTGILSQFWLYWKLENTSSVTQKYLEKEDPEALKLFKEVISKHLDYTFSKEKIKNGEAFSGLDTFLSNQKISESERKQILSAIETTKTGGIVEAVSLKALLASTNSSVKEIIKLMGIGYNHGDTVAEVEAGKFANGTIQFMLEQLSTNYSCGGIEDDIRETFKNSKDNEAFHLNIKLVDLYKMPKSRTKLLKILDMYIANIHAERKDTEILKKVRNLIVSKHKSETMTASLENKVVQDQIDTVAKGISTKIGGKSKNFNSVKAIVGFDSTVKKLVENVEKATKYNQEAKAEIKEQTVEITEQTFQKILTILGMDPQKITRELIMSSAALRSEVMNRIGSNKELLEKTLTKKEIDQLWALQSEIVSKMKADLLILDTFGKVNDFHSNNQKELKTFYPVIAAQREELNIDHRELATATYTELRTHKDYTPSSNVDIQTIQSFPPGTPIQLDTNTIFTLSNNGSCSIITPYSIQIIPPEKTNIALGLIWAAKIFPGLDFIGGLQEALQLHSKSPILAKMKDGVSNREQCNLIKHYATVLGIHDYNDNADTPDALIQSIKNCLPIGKSFWELAKEQWLLRNDGTINPIRLGNTFQAPSVYQKTQEAQNATRNKESEYSMT